MRVAGKLSWQNKRNTDIIIDYNTLYDKFINKQLTTADIAKEYNCSTSVIIKYLKLYNISIDLIK